MDNVLPRTDEHQRFRTQFSQLSSSLRDRIYPADCSEDHRLGMCPAKGTIQYLRNEC